MFSRPRKLLLVGLTLSVMPLLSFPVSAASGATRPGQEPVHSVPVPVKTRPVTHDPYAPSYQHSYRHGAIPTLGAHARIQAYNQLHPADDSNNLTYHGGVDGIGVTTGREKVYLVFYGSQWGKIGVDGSGNTTFSGDTSGMAPRLQQLFKGIGASNESWSAVAMQYCQGVTTGTVTCPASSQHVGYATDGALEGVWADTSAASPNTATGHDLATASIAAASHFGNTSAASNRNAQYVIVSPPGTHPDGFPTASFCAWHSWNGDTSLGGGAATSSVGDVAFTNLPYIPDAKSSCGQSYINAGTKGLLDGVTIVAGHEFSETITDQTIGGWLDSSGSENGDKCAWIKSGEGAAANVGFATGSFPMQSTWSNEISGCQMTRSFTQAPSSAVNLYVGNIAAGATNRYCFNFDSHRMDGAAVVSATARTPNVVIATVSTDLEYRASYGWVYCATLQNASATGSGVDLSARAALPAKYSYSPYQSSLAGGATGRYCFNFNSHTETSPVAAAAAATEPNVILTTVSTDLENRENYGWVYCATIKNSSTLSTTFTLMTKAAINSTNAFDYDAGYLYAGSTERYCFNYPATAVTALVNAKASAYNTILTTVGTDRENRAGYGLVYCATIRNSSSTGTDIYLQTQAGL